MENLAWTDITLVAGAGSGTWKKYDQVSKGVSAAEDIVFDGTPQFTFADRRTAGAAPGVLTVTPTATGVTLASSNGADVGVIRVLAMYRPPPNIAAYGAQ